MLPADELAAVRAEAERALPDTCTIQTLTQTNTKGSISKSYADTYTDVPCRLAAVQIDAKDQAIGTVLSAVTDFVLTVPYDQAVGHTDRVVHEGVTYEVVSVMNDQGSYRTARRARVRRVQ